MALFGLPAPLVVWSTFGIITTPIVFYDARRRGSNRARLWALATLVTFGHAALFYLLERDDPGQREQEGGQYLLPGQQSSKETSTDSGSSEARS
jgi:hypothetical protein